MTGVESLTVSERRVAELVAEGRSNKEVARAQFVTRSTVESHLRSIFRKLDVASRHEIAPLLVEKSSLTLNDANGAQGERASSA